MGKAASHVDVYARASRNLKDDAKQVSRLATRFGGVVSSFSSSWWAGEKPPHRRALSSAGAGYFFFGKNGK